MSSLGTQGLFLWKLNRIGEKTLINRRKNANYIDIPCPMGCGKMIKGISKSHWLHNFEIHLSGKKHKIRNEDEQKRLVEKFGKRAIEHL